MSRCKRIYNIIPWVYSVVPREACRKRVEIHMVPMTQIRERAALRAQLGGAARPCEEPVLVALERYWKMLCSLDSFSCCGGGRSDRLDR